MRPENTAVQEPQFKATMKRYFQAIFPACDDAQIDIELKRRNSPLDFLKRIFKNETSYDVHVYVGGDRRFPAAQFGFIDKPKSIAEKFEIQHPSNDFKKGYARCTLSDIAKPDEKELKPIRQTLFSDYEKRVLKKNRGIITPKIFVDYLNAFRQLMGVNHDIDIKKIEGNHLSHRLHIHHFLSMQKVNEIDNVILVGELKQSPLPADLNLFKKIKLSRVDFSQITYTDHNHFKNMMDAILANPNAKSITISETQARLLTRDQVKQIQTGKLIITQKKLQTVQPSVYRLSGYSADDIKYAHHPDAVRDLMEKLARAARIQLRSTVFYDKGTITKQTLEDFLIPNHPLSAEKFAELVRNGVRFFRGIYIEGDIKLEDLDLSTLDMQGVHFDGKLKLVNCTLSNKTNFEQARINHIVFENTHHSNANFKKMSCDSYATNTDRHDDITEHNESIVYFYIAEKNKLYVDTQKGEEVIVNNWIPLTLTLGDIKAVHERLKSKLQDIPGARKNWFESISEYTSLVSLFEFAEKNPDSTAAIAIEIALNKDNHPHSFFERNGFCVLYDDEQKDRFLNLLLDRKAVEAKFPFDQDGFCVIPKAFVDEMHKAYDARAAYFEDEAETTAPEMIAALNKRHFFFRGMRITDSVDLSHLRNKDLSHCDFANVTFTDTVNLSGCDLVKANLTNATFQGKVIIDEKTKVSRQQIEKWHKDNKLIYQIGKYQFQFDGDVLNVNNNTSKYDQKKIVDVIHTLMRFKGENGISFASVKEALIYAIQHPKSAAHFALTEIAPVLFDSSDNLTVYQRELRELKKMLFFELAEEGAESKEKYPNIRKLLPGGNVFFASLFNIPTYYSVERVVTSNDKYKASVVDLAPAVKPAPILPQSRSASSNGMSDEVQSTIETPPKSPVAKQVVSSNPHSTFATTATVAAKTGPVVQSQPLVLEDVAHDGNCFFHAVLQQLRDQGLRTDIKDHQQLRNEIVNYLRKNQARFFHEYNAEGVLVIRTAQHGEQTVDNFLNRMRIDSQYAEEPVSHAAAELFNVTILVVDTQGGQYFVNNNPEATHLIKLYHQRNNYVEHFQIVRSHPIDPKIEAKLPVHLREQYHYHSMQNNSQLRNR